MFPNETLYTHRSVPNPILVSFQKGVFHQLMGADTETYSQTLGRAQETPQKRGRKGCRRTWPTEISYAGLTETEVAAVEPAGVCTRPSVYIHVVIV